jgi:hypothetical protein
VRHAQLVGFEHQVVGDERVQVDPLQTTARAQRRRGFGEEPLEDLRPRVAVHEREPGEVTRRFGLRRVAEELRRSSHHVPATAALRQQPPERPEHTQTGRNGVPRVARVAAEDLVAAVACERDLDLCGDRAAEVPERDRGGICKRLLESRRDLGQVVGHARLDDELLVHAADRARDLAGGPALVVVGVREADGERAQRLVQLLRGERGDQRGVEPTGEEHRERNVRAEMDAHGLRQCFLEVLRARLGAPVALLARGSGFVNEELCRRELPRTREPRPLAGDVAEHEIVGDRLRIRLRGRAEREQGREL